MRSMEQVSARVWVATAATWSTTSTLVTADDGACLLIDPALTPAEIGAIARWLAARGLSVAAGFSTHPHWDHLLWSAQLPHVPRWASAAGAAWAADHGAELAAQAARDLPGHTWEVIGGTSPLPAGRTELPWHGPRATVLDTPAHAPGHAALWLPEERVLVAGDLLSEREVPLLDLDRADPVGDHRRALARLGEVLPDCDVLVPGHGTVTGAAGAAARVAADLAYLDAVEARRAPADARLADAWVRAEHERQVRALDGLPH